MTLHPSSSYRAFCFITLILMVASPAQPTAQLRPIKQIRYVMGTLCEITVFPRSPSPEIQSDPEVEAKAAIHAAFSELKRIDAVLSNWKADSELMRMNLRASAPGDPRPWVEVSEELFERLQIALRVARETNGVFDPTVGPLVRAWGFLPPCPTQTPCEAPPRAKAIEKARQQVGWEKVTLDAQNKRVQFTTAGMEIDLGGIAKGYAVDRAVQVLREHGIQVGLVNLGNSSLKALGAPEITCRPTKRGTDKCHGWPILVLDPRDGVSTAAKIYLRDGDAVGTSGTYEHTIGKGKNRRSHLIDPYTGQALGGETGVTVLCSNAELADALSKPFILRQTVTLKYARNILALHPDLGVILMSGKNGSLLQRNVGSVSRTGVESRIVVYSGKNGKP